MLFELLDVVKVRASYNFVLAAPIITTGVFDQESRNTCRDGFSWNLQSSTGTIPQDVTEEQVMADPRLYVSGREGPKMNDDSEILL